MCTYPDTGSSVDTYIQTYVNSGPTEEGKIKLWFTDMTDKHA